MENKTIWTVLAALLLSRKFWLAVIGLIGTLVLYFQRAIDAEMLVDAIVALVGILIAAIAGEDMALKLGK